MAGQADSQSVEPNFDYMFKTLIVGDAGVGKTAFLVRYTDGTWVSDYIPTVGIDFKVKTLTRYGSFRKLGMEM